MLSTTMQNCCQLLWSQQRELQALRQGMAQLQLQFERAHQNSEEHSNLNRGFDSALPPSSSLPNLVSLPNPAQQSQQQQPQLNNQVPPGNRANNYWDNFRR